MMQGMLILLIAAGAINQPAVEPPAQVSPAVQESVSSPVAEAAPAKSSSEETAAPVILEKEHYVNAKGVNTFILKGTRKSDPALQNLRAEEYAQRQARLDADRAYALERQRLENERARLAAEGQARSAPAPESPPIIVNNYYPQPNYFPFYSGWTVGPYTPTISSSNPVPVTKNPTETPEPLHHGGNWSGFTHGGFYGIP